MSKEVSKRFIQHWNHQQTNQGTLQPRSLYRAADQWRHVIHHGHESSL